MKKRIKIIVIVILSLIFVSWLTILIIDKSRAKVGKKPLIVLKEEKLIYEDGFVNEYYSFLYVMRIYKRDIIKENEFTFYLYPAKFHYLSTGNINDLKDLILDSTLQKGNYLKFNGLVSSFSDDLTMYPYNFAIVVGEKLEKSEETIFDENFGMICPKKDIRFLEEEKTYEVEDEIILYARIKQVVNNNGKTTVTLDNCIIE